MLDATGRIVTWNDGAQRIKGYTADEVIGRHFSLFYPSEEARSRKPDWELEVAKREGRYAEEGWRLRKDGTRFWASVVITALRDQAGRLRGFGKVTRDLTERQEQEEARNARRSSWTVIPRGSQPSSPTSSTTRSSTRPPAGKSTAQPAHRRHRSCLACGTRASASRASTCRCCSRGSDACRPNRT